MKAALTILIATLVSSLASAQHDHPSLHGMLMVGKDKVYLSHLPMFHSPHDYQVIFEATLPAESHEVYKQHLATAGNEIFTLAPENFVLPEMAHNPQPFRAQIFKGHFERGGMKIADTTVEVKTLFFKKFDPKATKPLVEKLIHFGNSDEQFTAHEIFAKPDFDQIIAIDPVTGAKKIIYTEFGDLSH